MAKKKRSKKDNNALLLLGAIVGGFAFYQMSQKDQKEEDNGAGSGGSGSSSGLPRGLSNNNPLNIILTDLAWKGKIPKEQNTDGFFEQFTDPTYGYRAAIKNLRYYVDNEGRDTIRKIVELWNEGPDENYIAYVTNRTGIGATAKIPRDFFYNADKLWPLVQAMAEFENNPKFSNLIKYDQYYKGFKIA